MTFTKKSKVTVYGAADSDESPSPESPRLSSIDAGEQVDMLYDASENRFPVIAHLDPGVAHCFMSPKAAEKCGVRSVNVDTDVTLRNEYTDKSIGIGIFQRKLLFPGCVNNMYAPECSPAKQNHGKSRVSVAPSRQSCRGFEN